MTFSEAQIADGALDRDETGLPAWPDGITASGEEAVTFKEWIALNPHPRVFQPRIQWVLDESVTEDRITVHAEAGDVLRILVICQDFKAPVTVGTWEGGAFVSAEHQPGCGQPADLPPVGAAGEVTLGYQAPAGTRARLVVIAQDPSNLEPPPPFADDGSPRFLPEGAEPRENLFAALPWRFMDALPQDLFAAQGQGRSMQELLAAAPEPGVLDPSREEVVAEVAGVGVVGPEPGMGGERPDGMVRLALVCVDPFSGPSSVGVQDPASGAYVPLGWSDVCGGYSVTLPRSQARELTAVADVQEGAAFRLVEIAESSGP